LTIRESNPEEAIVSVPILTDPGAQPAFGTGLVPGRKAAEVWR